MLQNRREWSRYEVQEVMALGDVRSQFRPFIVRKLRNRNPKAVVVINDNTQMG